MPKKSRYVIVRDNRAGVYAGIKLKREDGKCVLKNARQIWSWQGRLSVADIAARGVGEGSKLSPPNARIELFDVISIHDASSAARANIEGVASWR